MLPSNIFNVNKNYFSNDRSLFLQEENGLLDTVNKSHQDIWDIYKKLRSMDWAEDDFDYAPCNAEFKTCSKSTYEIMIKTLMWQWETDSVAAFNIGPVVAPFVSSSELWTAWSFVTANELIHATTYSEIVRNSFDKPHEVIANVTAEVEAFQRLQTAARVFSHVKEMSHKVGMGIVARDSEEAYDAIMLYTFALLCMERIQFMSSFAVTFSFAEMGSFMPIGKAVQKICADEFLGHVALDKAILLNELSTPKGQASYRRIKPTVESLIEEVTACELHWNKHLFSDNRQLAGMTESHLSDWTLFSAQDVYDFCDIKSPFKEIRKNPLGFITDWIDLNVNQASPQEEKTGNYLLGGLKDTAGNKVFTLDDL